MKAWKMENLERYRAHFDTSYKDYADVRYAEICSLVSIYDSGRAFAMLASSEFSEFEALLRPLIAIKNYKSRVPFPEGLHKTITCIASIREQAVDSSDILKNHQNLFTELLDIQGFQLSTASAILHFYHPEFFPIVDVNVESACALLVKRYPSDFLDLVPPKIPAPNTSASNKKRKYLQFIEFIDQVRDLQGEHGARPSLRDTDKALMVLGVAHLRESIENPPP